MYLHSYSALILSSYFSCDSLVLLSQERDDDEREEAIEGEDLYDLDSDEPHMVVPVSSLGSIEMLS